MSQPPQPPTWGGPPGNYPPPPWSGQPEQPSGMSNKAKFWIGVVLVLPALALSGTVFGIATSVADNGASSSAAGAVSGILSLLMFCGFIAALVIEKTRWFAIGMLAGGAALFILAAGACIVLLASFSNY